VIRKDDEDGTFLYWYDNEKTKIESHKTYKDGEIVGVWTSWNEKGQKEWEGTLEEYEAEEARKGEEARLAAAAKRAVAEKLAVAKAAAEAAAKRAAATQLLINVSTTTPLPDELISIQWNISKPVKVSYKYNQYYTTIYNTTNNVNVQKCFWKVPKHLKGKAVHVRAEEIGNEENWDLIDLFVLDDLKVIKYSKSEMAVNQDDEKKNKDNNKSPLSNIFLYSCGYFI
jgi:ribosomal silencing factor RsfS